MQDISEKMAAAYGEMLQLLEDGAVYSAYPIEFSADFDLSLIHISEPTRPY